MKKLNNKGMTIIELLVSFILLVIVMASLYNTVSVYRTRQNIESYKSKIISYKNLLTKEIEDDVIKKGLVHAEVIDNLLDSKNDSYVNKESEGKRFDTDMTINLLFKDGSKKVITIISKHAFEYSKCSNSTDVACNNDHDDVYSIGYGTSVDSSDYTIYTLPDLGYAFNGNKKCSDKRGCKIYDFSINTINVNVEDNIFNFYVGFYHPNFETRYGINIVAPLKLI